MSHSIALIAFDGFQLLDLAGPAAVFGAANDRLGKEAYSIKYIAVEAPAVRSGCGLSIIASGLADVSPESIDSILISGGEDAGLRKLIANRSVRDWTICAVKAASRYGSICSGSIALAAWGLIGDRRFASHWEAVPEIRKRWPDLNLDPEPIFVNDGPLWTSAGVTTGIDMALAIVEADHGAGVARAVAQRLVLSVRRPGWQSQYSPTLAAQGARDGRYSDLIGWIAAHLDQPLGVETLAEQAGESTRSFHRNFTAAVGATPARYVMTRRLDHARILIGQGLSLKQVAAGCGFADAAHLSAAFQKQFGMTASAFRLVHGA
jgi:transcriptional regulator GlxA family with amidase domain